MPNCPICGKPATEAAKPFCSPRCARVDLGRWLNESYRVPARDDEAGEEAADRPPGRAGDEAG